MGSQERRRLAASGGRSAGRVKTSPRTSPRSPTISPRAPAIATATAAAAAAARMLDDDTNSSAVASARSLESDYPCPYDPSPMTSPSTLFRWRGGAAAGTVHLFIAHDNPQVGGCALSRPPVQTPYRGPVSRPPVCVNPVSNRSG
jgi:hypothetical protein